MKNAKHVVDVMKPSDALDEYGQKTNEGEVYRANVPCSIETLSGSEAALARQNFPTATLTVRMYGDPAKPTTTSHFLLMKGTKRRFEIGSVTDQDQNGVVLELLCGEVT